MNATQSPERHASDAGDGHADALAALPPLREVVAAFGIAPRKALGQNFLFDLNLTRRIARAGGPLDDAAIVEIGPGPGGLTRALLLEGARELVAIERDPRAAPALQAIAEASGRLTVVAGDALTVDYDRIGDGSAIRIVANLPYNVGTALLVRWLTAPVWPPRWKSLTLMFQKEVAERIVAMPGAPAYGRLSVLAQWRSRPRLLFEVPRQAFTPPPKVTSAVVRIEPAAAPEGVSVAALEAVTAAAFGQRRKMLRSSLRSLWLRPEDVLEIAGIAPTDRAERVPIERFIALARLLECDIDEHTSSASPLRGGRVDGP